MTKWVMAVKIQFCICLDAAGKPGKNSEIGRHRDLNPEPPEYESPRSGLAQLLT